MAFSGVTPGRGVTRTQYNGVS